MRIAPTLQRTVLATSLWALCGLASAAAVPAFDIQVGDMAADQWQQTTTAHVGPGSTASSVQTQAGSVSDTFWRTNFAMPQVPAPLTSTEVVANVYLLQAWDPALQGAVDRISVQLDARGLASSFGNQVVGFVRPVIDQGGQLFAVRASDLTVSVGGSFATLAWTQEDSDDWRAADGSAALPDFSAQGSPIHFGYRFGLSVICSGTGSCSATSSSLGVDNFRVDVTAAVPVDGTVPEPALPALLLAGMLAAGLSRRRRA